MTFHCGADTIIIKDAELQTDPVDQSQYRDWTDPATISRTPVERCSVQDYPSISDTEDNRAREFVLGWYQVWMPEDAPDIIKHTSRIEFDGDEYELKGNVRRWRTHSGALHHYYFVMVLVSESVQAVS